MATTSQQVSVMSGRHIAFVLPLILLHLACALVLVTGVSWPAVMALVCSSTLQVFGITAGYHRLLAHRSFKTSRGFQFLLAVCGVAAGQNGPLWWVGHHRHHHRHADRDGDTHSPRRSLFWSHMGWLFSPDCIAVRRRQVADLARFPELVQLERYSYLVNIGHAALLFGCGEAWHWADPDASTSGCQFLVWGFVVATVWAYHAIWSANSICHRFGRRRYPTPDDSRNNVLVALLTLGDGWHHNHHYCPNSVRHGFSRWEIDLNFTVLAMLSRLGLVWDLRMPPATITAPVTLPGGPRWIEAAARTDEKGALPTRSR